MAVEFVEADLRNLDEPSLGIIATCKAPDGWWGHAMRQDFFQSWDRPFSLWTQISRNEDKSGSSVFVDTGCAFSWSREATASMAGMGGAFLGRFLGFPMAMSATTMPIPAPVTGRPEVRFVSPWAVLDGIAFECGLLDGSRARQGDLVVLGEKVVGETPEQALAREQRFTRENAEEWASLGAGKPTMICLNATIDRTVMRHYMCHEMSGQETHIFVGVHLTGTDLVSMRSGYAPVAPNTWPFGQGPDRDPAGMLYYQCRWMYDKRFMGIMRPTDVSVEDFALIAETVGSTTKFSRKLLDQMDAERARRAKANHDDWKATSERILQEQRESTERLRQQNEEHRRQLALERQQRQRNDDIRMGRDRRVMDAWSEAIRGTERYCDPYGHMVEVPVTGPNQHAYYDHLTGRTIMSDVTSLDKPLEWEPLDPW